MPSTLASSLPYFGLSPDGSKMYALGNGAKTVFQYSLSTPWDVSTASYDSKNKSIAAQEGTNVHGVFFKIDGLKMYILGYTSNEVYK